MNQDGYDHLRASADADVPPAANPAWVIGDYHGIVPQDRSMIGWTIHLLTEADLAALPAGTFVYDIFGDRFAKGLDETVGDTRDGFTNFGLLVAPEVN